MISNNVNHKTFLGDRIQVPDAGAIHQPQVLKGDGDDLNFLSERQDEITFRFILHI